MQPDRGLARSRPALDDEGRFRVAGDQVVLVGLDRRDDVPHSLVADAVELLEQEVVDRGGRVRERAVEGLVADAGQRAAACAEAPPQGDAVRLGRRRRVERPRRGRLPVDDQRALVVVVHPAAADVDRVRGLLGVDPPEAEPALGVLEGAKTRGRPVLDRLRGLLGRRCARRLQQRLAHAVERRVGLVDVRLLGRQIRVRHRGRSLQVCDRHMCFTYTARSETPRPLTIPQPPAGQAGSLARARTRRALRRALAAAAPAGAPAARIRAARAHPGAGSGGEGRHRQPLPPPALSGETRGS